MGNLDTASPPHPKGMLITDAKVRAPPPPPPQRHCAQRRRREASPPQKPPQNPRSHSAAASSPGGDGGVESPWGGKREKGVGVGEGVRPPSIPGAGGGPRPISAADLAGPGLRRRTASGRNALGSAFGVPPSPVRPAGRETKSMTRGRRRRRRRRRRQVSPFIADLIGELGYERVHSVASGNRAMMLLEGKGGACIRDTGGFAKWDTSGPQARALPPGSYIYI